MTMRKVVLYQTVRPLRHVCSFCGEWHPVMFRALERNVFICSPCYLDARILDGEGNVIADCYESNKTPNEQFIEAIRKATELRAKGGE